jgi:hypothetical protein
MRPLAALLALAALGGPLAACGGGGSSHAKAGTSSFPHTTSTTTRTETTLTRAQALALSHAVNLRASDVPGLTASHERQHESAAERRLQRKLLLCVGPAGSSEQGPGGGSSPSFARHSGILQQGVSSSVNVAASSAAAAKALAELRSPHTRACLQGYLDALFAGPTFKHGHVDHVAITLGVPPSFGTTGSFAWRIAVKFTIHSIHVPFYLDVLGFVNGPAQVMLLSSGLPVPFPARAEEQLFSLLVARAKAHGV